MINRSLADKWLIRARSNLIRARQGKTDQGIVYEDLCFDCEQAAEKSLKGFLVLKGIVPPQTHSLSLLIETLEKQGITVPDSVKAEVSLTYYSVTTRYPGSSEDISRGEYLKALKGAEIVFGWVEEQYKLAD